MLVEAGRRTPTLILLRLISTSKPLLYTFSATRRTTIKKNDHREYNVYLDDGPAQTYNATSGCGGAFGQTCEQQQPTIKYFASNLDDSTHTLKVENLASINQSFFDFDYIILTVPSEYAPRSLSETGTSTSGDNPSPSSTGVGSPSSSQNGGADANTDAALPLSMLNPFLFLFFLALCFSKPRL